MLDQIPTGLGHAGHLMTQHGQGVLIVIPHAAFVIGDRDPK